MPLTPAQALAKSAKLTDDDKLALAAAKLNIDAYLGSKWPGGPFGMKCPAMTEVAMAHLVRAYEQHEWRATAMPIDGALAEAADTLRVGGVVEWMIQLMPRWTSEE